MTLPTGEQFELETSTASGDLKATITAVAAGIRTLSINGIDLVPPYGEDQTPPMGAGIVLATCGLASYARLPAALFGQRITPPRGIERPRGTPVGRAPEPVLDETLGHAEGAGATGRRTRVASLRGRSRCAIAVITMA